MDYLIFVKVVSIRLHNWNAPKDNATVNNNTNDVTFQSVFIIGMRQKVNLSIYLSIYLMFQSVFIIGMRQKGYKPLFVPFQCYVSIRLHNWNAPKAITNIAVIAMTASFNPSS